jgi:hypothetical protein
MFSFLNFLCILHVSPITTNPLNINWKVKFEARHFVMFPVFLPMSNVICSGLLHRTFVKPDGWHQHCCQDPEPWETATWRMSRVTVSFFYNKPIILLAVSLMFQSSFLCFPQLSQYSECQLINSPNTNSRQNRVSQPVWRDTRVSLSSESVCSE